MLFSLRIMSKYCNNICHLKGSLSRKVNVWPKLTFNRHYRVTNELRSSRSSCHSYDRIVLSEEIQNGINERKPIVALESTIITHGMPYPTNLETAIHVEKIVRHYGAVPMTIGIINGKICGGMSLEQMEFLANDHSKSKSEKLLKVSRRDIPIVMAKNLSGGTTVSATALIANKCGIKIFATGGIGGVHWDGESTLDISTDLTELGQTPIVVVSAGVKSILDIQRTLEVLETNGVCVAVYEGTEDGDGNVQFPSFFTRNSGCKVPHNIKNVTEAVLMIHHHEKMGLKSGILIAVPVPETHEIDGQFVNDAIVEALRMSKELNIRGKEVTPYILEKVNQLTHGASLKTNITLIKNNAKVAAQIACEYMKHMKHMSTDITKSNTVSVTANERFPKTSTDSSAQSSRDSNISPKMDNDRPQLRPVIIGASIFDIVSNTYTESLLLNGSTYKGNIGSSLGGVGRNLAECISRLGHNPLLITAIGNDSNGNEIINHNLQMDRKGYRILHDVPTSACIIILDGVGECRMMIGDMRAHEFIDKIHVSKFSDVICNAPMVVMDANIPYDTMKYILELCSESEVPIWYEPTDINIAAKIFSSFTKDHNALMFASPNVYELQVLSFAITKQKVEHPIQDINILPVNVLIERCKEIAKPIMEKYFHTMIVTMGHYGVLIISKSNFDDTLPLSNLFKQYDNSQFLNTMHLPQEDIKDEIVNVSGAGDCFAGAMISEILKRNSIEKSVYVGMKAAKISLLSHETVPSSIRSQLFDNQLNNTFKPL